MSYNGGVKCCGVVIEPNISGAEKGIRNTEKYLTLACVGSVNSRLLCMLCCCRLLSLVALALCLFQLPVESRDMALQLIVGGSKVSYDAGVANMLGLAGSVRGLKLLLQLQQLPHLVQKEGSVYSSEDV